MNESTVTPRVTQVATPTSGIHGRPTPDSLADVLERVLDKGIVVIGDIVVSLLDIELLTLKVRLFIASADTAREMGIDWWSNDPFFSGQASQPDQRELDEMRNRIKELEDKLDNDGNKSSARSRGRSRSAG
jgi:Gas vesicle protein